jgi:RimJ/RimL family protein N-acetyltransferase
MAYATLPKERIGGRSIDLRPAEADDAEFVLKLRLDPALNTHLSATTPALEPQREWIRRARLDPAQYYFIIEDKQGQPVGTVRIYDLQPDSFCWGSWILQPGAPRKAAIESALLVYEFAFYRLGFARCHFDVRKQNTRVVDFHQRFGAKIVGETADDHLFHFFKADYEATREQYRAFLP